MNEEAVLRERARRLAERQTDVEARPSLPTHILLELSDGRRCALALEDLIGVATVPVTLVPLAPEWLAGVTIYRGSVWFVIRAGDGPVVFTGRGGLALQVQCLHGSHFIDPHQLTDLPEPAPGLPSRLRAGQATPEGFLLLGFEGL